MIIHSGSDIHRQHLTLSRYLAKGDLLVLAGDYDCETEELTYTFLKWCLKISKNYTYGIVMIAGNHDQYIADNLDEVKEFLKGSKVHLLINEFLTLENGFKIFGSPNTEVVGSQYYYNAFCGTFKDLEHTYKKIPNNLDLLITHCPPRGILDKYIGSIALETKIKQVKPKIHIFGHVHEAHGHFHDENRYRTQFFNVSIVGTTTEGPYEPTIIEYDVENHEILNWTMNIMDVT